MEKLLARLEDFKQYQVHKFIKARVKNYGGDALNDKTDWGLWNWDEIMAHLLREVEEFKEAHAANDDSIPSIEAMKNELADVANLAFVLWGKLEYED